MAGDDLAIPEWVVSGHAVVARMSCQLATPFGQDTSDLILFFLAIEMDEIKVVGPRDGFGLTQCT